VCISTLPEEKEKERDEKVSGEICVPEGDDLDGDRETTVDSSDHYCAKDIIIGVGLRDRETEGMRTQRLSATLTV
jgi:hypothetical protein